jgi:hypothetical protein
MSENEIEKKRRRSNDGKFGTESYREVKDGLLDAYRRLRLVGREKGDRIFPGHLLEAVLIWFLTEPEAAQERIVVEGRRIARILDAMTELGPTLGPGMYREATAEKKLRGVSGALFPGLESDEIGGVCSGQKRRRIKQNHKNGTGGRGR